MFQLRESLQQCFSWTHPFPEILTDDELIYLLLTAHVIKQFSTFRADPSAFAR